MGASVVRSQHGHRLTGEGPTCDSINRFLQHLEARRYSPATVRAYAFDLSNFTAFLVDRALGLAEVTPTDLFDYLDWQLSARRPVAGKVVAIGGFRVAPATMNRRIASVRGLFEYLVTVGSREDNPVPAARRSSGLRTARRGLLGHLGPGRPRGGGRLVRQPQRLTESLDTSDVTAFFTDLETHRDRAIVLAMVLGGLRAAEVRSLHLADVDMGLRRVRVVGKGGRERIIPVDVAFFTECAAYVQAERPSGCRTPECFVVLHGPTRGAPLSEDGLRKVFRTHRSRSGAIRVRLHRLRHTYGTELASAGMDLLVLRELMGHVSPETTARYVHQSPDTLAVEFAAARAVLGR
jgi:site-specific recombinase XerD